MSPAEVNKSPLVAIVGSARIEQSVIRWQQASELGAAFADSGYEVMTGGYGGLMAAVAQGASAAGGKTIGLPMKNWDYLTPDSSHQELRWSENYFERLAHLLSADYLVVLDGGIGTLSEMALAWAIAQTEVKHAQIIVLGEGIKELLSNFQSSLVISQPDMDVLFFYDSHEEIVNHIKSGIGTIQSVKKAHG